MVFEGCFKCSAEVYQQLDIIYMYILQGLFCFRLVSYHTRWGAMKLLVRAEFTKQV